jgi:two-component system response regulator
MITTVIQKTDEASMQNANAQDIPSVLIVEDSLPDYQSVLRVFRKIGMRNPVHHCETGQQALDFLTQDGNPRPGIILLDLNLPGTDGRDVLRWIKNKQALKSIPVVIFSTSDSDKDIAECYESGANGYITKPVDLEQLYKVIDSVMTFWLQTAALPGTGPESQSLDKKK